MKGRQSVRAKVAKKVADELFSLCSRRARGYEKSKKKLVEMINIANECLDYITLLLETRGRPPRPQRLPKAADCKSTSKMILSL